MDNNTKLYELNNTDECDVESEFQKGWKAAIESFSDNVDADNIDFDKILKSVDKVSYMNTVYSNEETLFIELFNYQYADILYNFFTYKHLSFYENHKEYSQMYDIHNYKVIGACISISSIEDNINYVSISVVTEDEINGEKDIETEEVDLNNPIYKEKIQLIYNHFQ